MAKDPEKIAREQSPIGEFSLEDAVVLQQARQLEQADPHGAVSAAKADIGTETISTADLPEDSEASADTLAAQIDNIFEGPDELDIPTDPRFNTMLKGMQVGLAEIARMRDKNVPRHELREAVARWGNKHNETWAGLKVRIEPTKKGVIWIRSDRSDSATPTELGDVIEGTILLTSVSGSAVAGGSITLYDATYLERHRRKGVRPSEPEEHELSMVNIYELFYLNRKSQQAPITARDFTAAIAINTPR